MKQDNRLIQRFSIAVPARVTCNESASQNPCVELFSRDVCSGGAFFLTPQPYDAGTRVEVRMLLQPQHMASLGDKKAQVVISGKVLRSEKEGMAVRFDRRYKISSVKG